MKKISGLEFELTEYYILGFVIFLVLFLLFCLQTNYPDITALPRKTKVDMLTNSVEPLCDSDKIASNLPKLLIVDDNKTPNIVDDDIISFNTSYYSLLLPYDLNKYTEIFGANKSTKKLTVALKQMNTQIIQNGLLSNPGEIKQLEDLITLFEQASKIQDQAYLIIRSTNTSYKKQPRELSSVDYLYTDFPQNIKLKQEKIVKILVRKNTGSSLEAIKLIRILNNTLLLLNYKTYADYYNLELDQEFDSRDFKKPVVYNIIEIIEKEIANLN